MGIAHLLDTISLWVRGYVPYGALFLAAKIAGGIVSHLRVGDPVVMAAPALRLLALLCGLAFVRRSELSIA
ncbi:hypothetical protein [Methylobacterium sp. ap11]|uniref:hypothetical protein n=1 Tax=Methylobacterium sp. ap11 TaxID=1761799 RepID=UPI001FCD2EE7|nr:hypothetical protein [Methylobacterium sp. ap11]